MLSIVRDPDIRSVRDLRGKHIELLQNLMHQTITAIRRVYGLDRDQMRIFVHYPPTYYHLHIHFTCLAISKGISLGKAIFLEDIIDNLKMDPQYYKKANMSCVVATNEKL